MKAIAHALMMLLLVVWLYPEAWLLLAFLSLAGGVAAVFTAPRIQHLRAWVVMGVASLMAGLAQLLAPFLAHGVTQTSMGMLQAKTVGTVGIPLFLLAFVMRLLEKKHKVWLWIEVGMLVGGVTMFFMPHEWGAVNRPFAFTDSLLSSGIDPTVLFMMIGIMVSVAAGFMLLRATKRKHVMFQAVFWLLFLLLVSFVAPWVPMPKAQAPEKEKQQEQSGKGKADNPFADSPKENDRNIPQAIVAFFQDVTPPDNVYYFREGSLSTYNQHHMLASPADVGLKPKDAVDLSLPSNLQTRVGHLAPIKKMGAVEARFFTPVSNPDNKRFNEVYNVESFVDDAPIALEASLWNPRWTEEQKAQYLQGSNDPRYRTLAETISPNTSLPQLQRVLDIVGWLEREGTYDLNSHHERAPDPVAHFLFGSGPGGEGDRTGYCVHFAHAAVLLLRSIGIPSRIGIGYAADASRRRGSSALLIGSNDRHEWPEVYVEGRGWTVMDVHPKQVLRAPNQEIDADLQQLLGELLRGQDTPNHEHPIKKTLQWLLWLRDRLPWILMASLLACLLASYIKKWFVLNDERNIARVYRGTLLSLAGSSVMRSKNESFEKFADRNKGVDSLGDLTRLYLKSRFSKDKQQEDLRLAIELKKNVLEAKKGKTSSKQRFLSIFDPKSSLR